MERRFENLPLMNICRISFRANLKLKRLVFIKENQCSINGGFYV